MNLIFIPEVASARNIANLRPFLWYKAVPKLCPKYVRNIKTYLRASKSGSPYKRSYCMVNLLFSALCAFSAPPLHGRSHRFKSCIAHSFSTNDLRHHSARQNHRCGQICAQIRDGEQVYDRLKEFIGQVRIDFRGSTGLVSKENLDHPEISGKHGEMAS